MGYKLINFLLLNGRITDSNSDSFVYTLNIEEKSIRIIEEFYEFNFIEQIKDNQNKILTIENLSNLKNQSISVEFIIAELKKIGYFLTIKDFILNNRFDTPSEFYIGEISYLSSSHEKNEYLEKYEAISTLINRLITKAKFISEEYIKTICLVQDNSFIEIPIETIVYEEYLEYKNVQLINQYIEDIDAYKEKRTIFLKQLIDFLSNKTKKERFNELILYFEEFYETCNTSFEYYLSNFSFNKIKLELDTSVLEYSKNIRSIINESQSKLIAIPAAFILGVSQIDFSNPLILKNGLITASAFLFSYIISIFINNQKNGIEIISDNLNNYKINYERSKSTQFEEAQELKSLTELIKKSYEKTEIEIVKQGKRLRILQFCNWAISIALLISIIIVFLIKLNWNCSSS